MLMRHGDRSGYWWLRPKAARAAADAAAEAKAAAEMEARRAAVAKRRAELEARWHAEAELEQQTDVLMAWASDRQESPRQS